jgi:hypothetical protein
MDRYDKEIHVFRWLRLPKSRKKAKRNMQLEKKTLFLLTKNSKIQRMRLC